MWIQTQARNFKSVNCRGFKDLLGVVVYYCRTYVKAVRGRRVKRGDVRYGMLRAAACVDESNHHALMYVWHGQTVREDRVGEASARVVVIPLPMVSR